MVDFGSNDIYKQMGKIYVPIEDLRKATEKALKNQGYNDDEVKSNLFIHNISYFKYFIICAVLKLF